MLDFLGIYLFLQKRYCMKLSIFYTLISLFPLVAYCGECENHTAEKIEQYIETILVLDACLQESSDAQRLSVDADVVSLVTVYDQIRPYLTDHKRFLADECIARLERYINVKAPRTDSPVITAAYTVDSSYIQLRDSYLRNLILTGTLVAPNFITQLSGLYVLKSGDTMTGSLTMADQQGIIFDDTADGSVLIQAPATVSSSYTLQLPTGSGTAGQVLASQGGNPDQLYWRTIEAVVTSTVQLYGDVIGSSTANRVNTICDFSACSLVDTVTTATSADMGGTLVIRDSNGNFSAGTITANLTGTATYATNALLSVTADFAYATSMAFSFTGNLSGDVIGTQTATVIAFVCGIPACTLAQTYSVIISGTSYDIPNTLVRRDSTGSFVATNVTTTGYTIFTNPAGTQSVSLTAGALAATYTLVLPTAQATAPNQALFNNGTGQLSWVTTLTGGIESVNSATAPAQYLATSTGGTTLGFFSTTFGNTLIVPYVGNLSGSDVGLITGADWQNFEYAYTVVSSATSADIPLSLVLRDTVGSFVATTITLTGNFLINYSVLGDNDTGTPFIQAPLYKNTSIGLGAGSSLTGSGNIYIGCGAGGQHEGNSSIFLGYTRTYTGDGLIFIGNPSTAPDGNSATTTTIYGCINLPEVNAGSGYIASFDTNGQLLRATSSAKYKQNIKPVADAVSEKIYDLRPVVFNFKNSPATDSYGLIAEQVHLVLPELVIYGSDGQPDSVNYLSLQIVALDALMRQHSKIQELESRYVSLIAKIEEQERVINALQKRT